MRLFNWTEAFSLFFTGKSQFEQKAQQCLLFKQSILVPVVSELLPSCMHYIKIE